MCDPVTALLAASTAVTAAGQVYGGAAKSKQLSYQARVAEANRQQANDAAMDALDRGKIAARDQFRRNAQVQGAQVAAQSANGIEVGFGSSGQLAGDQAMFGAEDVQTIRENATRDSRSYSIQGANYGAQAAASRFEKGTLGVSTALGVGSTILGGATQVARYNSSIGRIG